MDGTIRRRIGLTPDEFRLLRLLAKQTQLEASHVLGVTPSTINRWETGKTPISPLKAKGIRKAFLEIAWPTSKQKSGENA